MVSGKPVTAVMGSPPDGPLTISELSNVISPFSVGVSHATRYPCNRRPKDGRIQFDVIHIHARAGEGPVIVVHAARANRIPTLGPLASHGRRYSQRKTTIAHLGGNSSRGILNRSNTVRMRPSVIMQILPNPVGGPIPCADTGGDYRELGVGRAPPPFGSQLNNRRNLLSTRRDPARRLPPRAVTSRRPSTRFYPEGGKNAA